MTIEKRLLMRWSRTPGCASDAERRALARALGRKRERMAFPDDFSAFIDPLRKRVIEKHSRQSEEGEAFRALREIRIRASPSWTAKSVDLWLWFVVEADQILTAGSSATSYIQKWMDLIRPRGRFTSVDGVCVMLDDLTATDYVESDPLDLDHVSIAAL